MTNYTIKAIEATGLLSKSQKTIIKYIYSLPSERGVTSLSIQQAVESSKQAVNANLQLLLKRNFISRKKDRIYMYYINLSKIKELEEEYNPQ